MNLIFWARLTKLLAELQGLSLLVLFSLFVIFADLDDIALFHSLLLIGVFFWCGYTYSFKNYKLFYYIVLVWYAWLLCSFGTIMIELEPILNEFYTVIIVTGSNVFWLLLVCSNVFQTCWNRMALVYAIFGIQMTLFSSSFCAFNETILEIGLRFIALLIVFLIHREKKMLAHKIIPLIFYIFNSPFLSTCISFGCHMVMIFLFNKKRKSKSHPKKKKKAITPSSDDEPADVNLIDLDV